MSRMILHKTLLYLRHRPRLGRGWATIMRPAVPVAACRQHAGQASAYIDDLLLCHDSWWSVAYVGQQAVLHTSETQVTCKHYLAPQKAHRSLRTFTPCL